MKKNSFNLFHKYLNQITIPKLFISKRYSILLSDGEEKVSLSIFQISLSNIAFIFHSYMVKILLKSIFVTKCKLIIQK